MQAYLMTHVLLVVALAAITGCAQILPQQKMNQLESMDTQTINKAVTVESTTGQATVIDKVNGIELVFVKGGCFQMGDTFGDGNSDERPVHEVCVSDFYLGRNEVTQAQWEKVMGSNPSINKECLDCPVDSVSWNMIQEYINKLNSRGKKYRLPTEAEWEYAARSGGKKEKWAGTSTLAEVGEFGWYSKNSDGASHKVGLKKPNAFGLYDMSGNVQEWCHDWFDKNYYVMSAKDNPAGPQTGRKRVLRGGSWFYYENSARVTNRDGKLPDTSENHFGFRLLAPVP